MKIATTWRNTLLLQRNKDNKNSTKLKNDATKSGTTISE